MDIKSTYSPAKIGATRGDYIRQNDGPIWHRAFLSPILKLSEDFDTSKSNLVAGFRFALKFQGYAIPLCFSTLCPPKLQRRLSYRTNRFGVWTIPSSK